MKNASSLHQPKHRNRVIQNQSGARLPQKVELSIQTVWRRGKMLQDIEPTSHVCHFERLEENTLQCTSHDQQLPLTPQGKIDRELFVSKIFLGQCCQECFQAQQYQRLKDKEVTYV